MKKEDWSWLAGTFWYVPELYLPAPQFSPDGEPPIWMSDQTVWQITEYEKGYFWGNCAVSVTLAEDAPANDTPNGLCLTGSITPDGRVLMSFMPINPAGSALATSGFGVTTLRETEWVFEMQMSANQNGSLLLHWAYMYQCRPGDAAWEELPGTKYSVPGFLEAAGFSTDVN
ncbi:hypothetical protein BTA51_29375 [Hahella sp. CCB-MM4]|uniref:hypothetical protein n=1 Tax=Hahella sp. (strain CCB-MM4) TaxID=1926491 RepID=UPI000B9C5215|nr:hypothetical protein [Hahella sp. CCB-MM4]OZG69738.1 hypothetical protein BTA51_29375 [Hahella sp. CCB-MM4]